jgi:hypothetical protein
MLTKLPFSRKMPGKDESPRTDPAMAITPRNDEQNLEILGAARKQWEHLREEKIRNDADVKRNEEELLAASKEAISAFGTADVEKLRAQVVQNYAENTASVEAFVATLNTVQQALNASEAKA